MGLIEKTTFNFIVKQGEKLVESSLLRKKCKIDVKELRYLPDQLSSDVVELYKPVQKVNASEIIKPDKLQNLADKGFSLSEMAAEYGVSQRTIRVYLKKFNIVTDAQKEFRMLKDYFCATTKELKAKAYSEIDKYLEQIAKEELKLKKYSTYEDCLQDVRLRFFEIINRFKQNGINSPYSILKILRETKPVLKPEIKTKRFSKTEIEFTDKGVELFENKDYGDYLWNYFYRHFIKLRDFYMLKQFIREDKNVVEIAKHFGLSVQRTKNILKNALPRLIPQLEKAVALEQVPERIKYAYKVAENSASKEINKI